MSLPLNLSAKRLGLSFLIFIVTGSLLLTGLLEPIEQYLMDLRFELSEPRAAQGEVVFIDIDSRSISSLDSWPWPRSYHAEMVKRLNQAGVSQIVFDIEFSTPSTSEDDQRLAEALRDSRAPVTLPIFKQAQLNNSGGVSEAINGPIQAFLEHSQLASINIWPASDGKIRTANSSEPFAGVLYPTLAARLAQLPTEEGHPFYIDYTIELNSLPRLSYGDILRNDFDPQLLAGKSVIIGASAIELRDQVPAPLYQIIPGPLLHMLAYESLVQQRALQRTDISTILLLSLLLSLLIPPLFRRLSWQQGTLLLTIFIAAAVYLPAILLNYLPLLVDVAPLLSAVLISHAAVTLIRIEHSAQLLFSERRRNQGIVEHSFDGIITVDRHGMIESLNPAAEKLFGVASKPRQQIEVAQLIPMLHFDSPQQHQQLISRLEQSPMEAIAIKASGHTFPIELTASRMQLHDRELHLFTSRDITEKKRQQEALQHKELFDSLTDLPNRKSLGQHINKITQDTEALMRPFSLLLLDLDNFKEINGTLGHQIGDRVLIEVAKRLAEQFPAPYLYRLGGDEFAIILDGLSDDQQIQQRVTEIIERLSPAILLDDFKLQLGMSIGGVKYPEHGDDTKTLLQHADVAMYSAKHHDEDYAIYASDSDPNNVRKLALRSRLNEAIEKQEFLVYYQPKVDLANWRISAAESLVRWDHPEYGIVMPDDFIPIAEKIGVVSALTRSIISVAIKDNIDWLAENPHNSVAVNLSTRDLISLDLANSLENLINEHAIAPSQLVLEVTESYVMADPKQALKTLIHLKGMGFKLAIDDYGTGYSSLEYLKQLPVDELKIDKSFVMDMANNRKDQAIVKSTIELAHNLDMKVVAEGVETLELMYALRDLGCDYAQGYYISRPITFDDFSKLRNQWGREQP